MVKLRRVPAEGPKDAKIAIVGLGPGATEEREGRPFVGAAGRLLDGALNHAGLLRSQCYVTNISEYRPPANNLNRLHEVGIDLGEQKQRLYAELQTVKPNVIIALGNDVLRTLTQKDGVMAWRGSVLESPYGKVIPTFHPAAIVRASHMKHPYEKRKIPLYPLLLFDLRKAVREAAFPEVRRKMRRLVTAPKFEQAEDFLGMCMRAEKVAVDIETLRGEVACVGFAVNEGYAMCVPFDTGVGSYWASARQEAEVWKMVMEVLANGKVKKIIQNALFELKFLGGHDRLRGVWWDTMLASHTIYPELPRGLDFLTSIYTDIPYYKHEGRYWQPGDDPHSWWRYNCLDCVVPYEVQEKQWCELEEAGLLELFLGGVMPQLGPACEMESRGVRVDFARVEHHKRVQEERVRGAQERLDAKAGWEVNVYSTKQVQKLLYDELRLPKQRKGRERKVTADEAALDKLALKFPQLEELQLIKQIRAARKLISSYLHDGVFDGDRVRFGVSVGGTETGRWSTGKTIWGKGLNIQTIPHTLRDIFVADEGMVLMYPDGSQAEARVVAWLAEEERLIEVFESGKKVHRVVAAMIYGKSEDEVSEREYDLGKRAVHGGNYGLGPERFVEVAKKYGGIDVSVAEARELIERYHALFPNIRNHYQRSIREQLQRNRTLVTPLGRKRVFTGAMGEDLFKEGYAHVAQSTIADWLNRSMVRAWWKARAEGVEVEWLVQIHDGVLLQAVDDAEVVRRVAEIVKWAFEWEFRCGSRMLCIPTDIKVGKDWLEMEDVRKVYGGCG